MLERDMWVPRTCIYLYLSIFTTLWGTVGVSTHKDAGSTGRGNRGEYPYLYEL